MTPGSLPGGRFYMLVNKASAFNQPVLVRLLFVRLLFCRHPTHYDIRRNMILVEQNSSA